MPRFTWAGAVLLNALKLITLVLCFTPFGLVVVPINVAYACMCRFSLGYEISLQDLVCLLLFGFFYTVSLKHKSEDHPFLILESSIANGFHQPSLPKNGVAQAPTVLMASPLHTRLQRAVRAAVCMSKELCREFESEHTAANEAKDAEHPHRNRSQIQRLIGNQFVLKQLVQQLRSANELARQLCESLENPEEDNVEGIPSQPPALDTLQPQEFFEASQTQPNDDTEVGPERRRTVGFQCEAFHVLTEHIKKGDLDYVSEAIDDVNFCEADHRRTALHIASAEGQSEICEYLLAKGSEVNASDYRLCTPLHAAAKQGHVSVCQVLLSKGADPEAQDFNGRSVLHSTARADHEDIHLVYDLIKDRADVNSPDLDGDTPLHALCWNVAGGDGLLQVLEELVQRGANVSSLNKRNETPLFNAVRNMDTFIVSKLLQAGASVLVKNVDGQTVQDVLKDIEASDDNERSDKLRVAELLEARLMEEEEDESETQSDIEASPYLAESLSAADTPMSSEPVSESELGSYVSTEA